MPNGHRFPTHTLFIASKNNPKKEKTMAGVAFQNEFGGLNLKLNPGVVLRWNDEVYFNLNPYANDYEYSRKAKVASDDDNFEDELFGDPPGGDELDEDQEETYFLDIPEDL